VRLKTIGRFTPYWDVWLIAAVLAGVNLPLLFGAGTGRYALIPSAVGSGEWWRLVTHPFAHITWYHLLLDGLPFFLIYPFLDEKKPFRHLVYVVASAAGAGWAGWAVPAVAESGFRGLSGVTYGVMAVAALEMATSRAGMRSQRVAGAVVLALLVAMVGGELITGRFPFEFLLFGMVGKPVLVCHAGGIIGALTAHLFLGAFSRKQRSAGGRA